jgi:hypothetical protein
MFYVLNMHLSKFLKMQVDASGYQVDESGILIRFLVISS